MCLAASLLFALILVALLMRSTARGQVIFAVVAGSFLAVLIAHQLFDTLRVVSSLARTSQRWQLSMMTPPLSSKPRCAAGMNCSQPMELRPSLPISRIKRASWNGYWGVRMVNGS